jgi:hypothetical protein
MPEVHGEESLVEIRRANQDDRYRDKGANAVELIEPGEIVEEQLGQCGNQQADA